MRLRQGSLAALAVVLVAAAPAVATPWSRGVHSLPGVAIPRIWTTVDDSERSPGYIFISPRVKDGDHTGPTILDADGRVVWFHRLSSTRTSVDLHPQVLNGKPVLTWGQRPPLVNAGDFYTGNSHNTYNVIAGPNYRIIARVRARGRGVVTDLHEFTITRANTALVLGSRVLRRDLRHYGGPRDGYIRDSLVQEVDVKTNKVLFAWSALAHLSPVHTYAPAPSSGVWDPYHANAVSEDSDDNLLITLRHFSQVVKIDRHTGTTIWKLGGKDSSFKVSRSARFSFPHDAQRAPDGTLTVFDNHLRSLGSTSGSSRGIRLDVDTTKRTATLARAYHHPAGSVLANSQGNVQTLPNGNVFVGWGSSPWFSEHAPDGHVVFAAHLQSVWNQSYRAYKSDWAGQPGGGPAVVASNRTGRLVVYVSWNGATNVAKWQVLGGATASSLAPVTTAPWQDFETKISHTGTPAVIQVNALDAAGTVLGRSELVTPKSK